MAAVGVLVADGGLSALAVWAAVAAEFEARGAQVVHADRGARVMIR